MQVWCDWQLTLCDPHLSALEVRFSRRCAIQIDVYLTLHQTQEEIGNKAIIKGSTTHQMRRYTTFEI